jgi:5-methyltetrahydropteroyltriglutamate--homocysteine methyltransferase
MKHSSERILTTHVGSLPRPRSLLDLMKQKYAGNSVDPDAFETELRRSVDEMVREQAKRGLDVITDGEMSKPGHAVYINERLRGFEQRPDHREERYVAEREAFPEYYEDYFKRAMLGGAIAPSHPMVCTGPISYCGHDALEADIARLQGALADVPHVEAFVPAVAPTGVGYNEYYKTQEEYIFAVAEALAEEYRAIVDAGFLLQVDDPFLPDVFLDASLDENQKDRQAAMYVDAINHSLKDIPAEKVRFHTCYGINQGPRVYEPDLPDMIDHVLNVNAGAYSFEAANPRHEHEYHMWENVKLPDGKLLLPGVITHASSVVEHPDYVAERIIRFAERVGRENVIASADCGFSSQAMYKTEVDTRIMWAKFKALVEGAKRASRTLWDPA